MNRLRPDLMYASVREYLCELEESGVDGLPTEEPWQPVHAVSPLPKGEGSRQGPGAPENTAPCPLPQAASLEELRQLIGDCQRCVLSQSRTNLVFGSGNPKARLLFVGEAPGADDDRQGLPFAGDAGHVLTRMIAAMGLKREEVYLCKVLKCRLPENRHPHKIEVTTCAPFVIQQIRLVQPEVIVALGTTAAQTLLDSKEPISRLRGKFHDCHGIPLMPTFHPSFLLHNKENKQHYWDVWSDLEQVLTTLNLPVPEKKQGQGSKKG